MNLKDVMKKPVFISSKERLESVAKLLTKTNSLGALVGKPMKIEGVVTKEDLVKHFGHKEFVSEIMTTSIIFADIDDSPAQVIKILKKNRINFIPLLKERVVVGVVSSKDLLPELEESNEKDFLFD